MPDDSQRGDGSFHPHAISLHANIVDPQISRRYSIKQCPVRLSPAGVVFFKDNFDCFLACDIAGATSANAVTHYEQPSLMMAGFDIIRRSLADAVFITFPNGTLIAYSTMINQLSHQLLPA
jgi:hypothetical protein